MPPSVRTTVAIYNALYFVTSLKCSRMYFSTRKQTSQSNDTDYLSIEKLMCYLHCNLNVFTLPQRLSTCGRKSNMHVAGISTFDLYFSSELVYVYCHCLSKCTARQAHSSSTDRRMKFQLYL